MQQRKSVEAFEWAKIICGTLVLITLVYTFLFRTVDVDGTSMMPNFQDGEKLVLSSAPYTPRYGDVVVVSRGSQEPLIKRVIALAGDTVEIDEATGDVYRNGKKLNESYINIPTCSESMEGVVTVGEGEVFIMGDNRSPSQSWDSRSFGCVPEENIVGKVCYRLYPFNRFGGI